MNRCPVARKISWTHGAFCVVRVYIHIGEHNRPIPLGSRVGSRDRRRHCDDALRCLWTKPAPCLDPPLPLDPCSPMLGGGPWTSDVTYRSGSAGCGPSPGRCRPTALTHGASSSCSGRRRPRRRRPAACRGRASSSRAPSRTCSPGTTLQR